MAVRPSGKEVCNSADAGTVPAGVSFNGENWPGDAEGTENGGVAADEVDWKRRSS